MKFIVCVTVESQTWYLHERGLRVNNPETAIRYDSRKDAECVGEYFAKFWEATEVLVREVSY